MCLYIQHTIWYKPPLKKKHGTVKHKPGFELKDPSARIPCQLCGFEVKSGNSPGHSMKVHMEVHKSQTALQCPISPCSTRIFTSKPSYTFPIQMYNHIERIHGIPFKLLIVNFKCKICDQTVIGRHLGKGSKLYGNGWKLRMERHIKIFHTDKVDDLKDFMAKWDKNFEKSELIFKEDVYEEEKCKMYIEDNIEKIYMNIVNKTPVVDLSLVKMESCS